MSLTIADLIFICLPAWFVSYSIYIIGLVKAEKKLHDKAHVYASLIMNELNDQHLIDMQDMAKVRKEVIKQILKINLTK